MPIGYFLSILTLGIGGVICLVANNITIIFATLIVVVVLLYTYTFIPQTIDDRIKDLKYKFKK